MNEDNQENVDKHDHEVKNNYEDKMKIRMHDDDTNCDDHDDG